MNKRKGTQPRDERGKFISVKKLIVVDEIGDVGIGPDTSKIFGYTATVTDDNDKLKNLHPRLGILRRKKYRSRDEIKGRDFGPIGRFRAKRIIKAETQPDVCIVYVEKGRDQPEDWERPKTKRGKVMIQYLGEVLEETGLKGQDVKVVIDHHDAYGKKKNCKRSGPAYRKCVEVMGTNADCRIEFAKGGPDKETIQVNDIISNSIYRGLTKNTIFKGWRGGRFVKRKKDDRL